MVYDFEIVKMPEHLGADELSQVFSKANVLHLHSSQDPEDPSGTSLQARVRLKD